MVRRTYENWYNDYTDIIWTKDSIVQVFHDEIATSTRKRMFYKNDLLTNYIMNSNSIGTTTKYVSYTYTDTLNPFYLPYIAPFIEREENYFYLLSDLLFRKQTISELELFYSNEVGNDNRYYYNVYNAKGQPTGSYMLPIDAAEALDILSWIEMRY